MRAINQQLAGIKSDQNHVKNYQMGLNDSTYPDIMEESKGDEKKRLLFA